MKKVILTFGVIGGFISIGLMICSMGLQKKIGYDKGAGELVGYTILVACALLIFFGIKSYRDNVLGGRISFGKAFMVGLLISLVASVCYVIGWEIYYHLFRPDCMSDYFAYMQQKARAGAISAADLQAKMAQLQKFKDMYDSPIWNPILTFIEPFPVFLAMSVIGAATLRRKTEPAAPAAVATV